MNPRRRRHARARRIARKRLTWRFLPTGKLRFYDADQIVLIFRDKDGNEIARCGPGGFAPGEHIVINPEPETLGLAREWTINCANVEIDIP